MRSLLSHMVCKPPFLKFPTPTLFSRLHPAHPSLWTLTTINTRSFITSPHFTRRKSLAPHCHPTLAPPMSFPHRHFSTTPEPQKSFRATFLSQPLSRKLMFTSSTLLLTYFIISRLSMGAFQSWNQFRRSSSIHHDLDLFGDSSIWFLGIFRQHDEMKLTFNSNPDYFRGAVNGIGKLSPEELLHIRQFALKELIAQECYLYNTYMDLEKFEEYIMNIIGIISKTKLKQFHGYAQIQWLHEIDEHLRDILKQVPQWKSTLSPFMLTSMTLELAVSRRRDSESQITNNSNNLIKTPITIDDALIQLAEHHHEALSHILARSSVFHSHYVNIREQINQVETILNDMDSTLIELQTSQNIKSLTIPQFMHTVPDLQEIINEIVSSEKKIRVLHDPFFNPQEPIPIYDDMGNVINSTPGNSVYSARRPVLPYVSIARPWTFPAHLMEAVPQKYIEMYEQTIQSNSD